MLANFIPYKNHNLILNSIKELINKTTIQFKFLFIGQDRGIKKILVKSIDQLQISNRVCFIENVTNPNDLIKVADISVICSLHEGFSNAILESMAMGLPVIASNVGGNPEAIKNNYNGFIFDLKKSYELTNYLLLLIEDNKLRKKLGLNSIKRVEEHFNIDYCVSQYLKIYQSFNSLYER
jgi:Glycosyltransferase